MFSGQVSRRCCVFGAHHIRPHPSSSSHQHILTSRVSSNPHVMRSYTAATWDHCEYKGHPVKAYIPAILPPNNIDMSYKHPVSQLSLLDASLQAQSNIDELDRISKNLSDSLVSGFLKKEAVLSNQIELNTRSLSQVIKQICGFSRPVENDDVKECNGIQRYIETYQLGIRALNHRKTMSVDILEDMHKALFSEDASQIGSGKLRDIIVTIGSSSPPYDRSFFPPTPKHIRELLNNLLEFTEDNKSDIPALVRLGVAHAQFETIQPFYNGNGHLGRILLMLRMVHSDVLDRYTLYPSYAFKVCRWLYFACLQDTRDHERWEPWLHFFVAAISHAAIDAIELTEALTALHNSQSSALGGSNSCNSDINQAKIDKLLEMTYRMPYLQKQTVSLLFHEDYSIAKELLEFFTRRGVLEIIEDENKEIWYHNKGIEEELNKERHVATYAAMMGDWMAVPDQKNK
eukprot:TRINITY_DN5202_c0_g1_i1.p1 TRINITY_DN5202_c0_g1~~TRINITY_DN5202_c0_g1_i1.p1  ORF type:complete len:459 (+),score=90.07 TRINITY_DN5202_c0_g1_i1:94-1470(+)